MTPQRPLFWNIEGQWLFYSLAVAAVAVFLVGLTAHLRIWARGVGRPTLGITPADGRRLVLDGLLGRRIFRGDPAAGLMHALILWGFVGLLVATILSAVDHYLWTFLRGSIYLAYATAADGAGVMLLGGLLWALLRRYLQRVRRLERRRGDLGVLLWLIGVCVTGFGVEGLRLAATEPAWASWSFAGRATSALWSSPPDISIAYPVLWWIHALASLGLVAAIPYTKLFHALAAPASVALAAQPLRGLRAEERGDRSLGWSAAQLVFLDACTRCGRCVEVCPASRAGEPFSPRAVVVGLREQLWRRRGDADAAGPLDESCWHCTTCGACLEVCPVFASPPAVLREVRRQVVEEGTAVPAHLSGALEKLFKYGNPWEASKKKRSKCAKELGLPDLTRPKKDQTTGPPSLCYFVGCTTSIDTRAQGLARSFAQILTHAQVAAGSLGKKEPCCGDIARRVGEDGLYEEQMEGCLGLLARHGIDRVVTSSPHCFHTFRNDYPAFTAKLPAEQQVHFEALHYVELLDELLRTGALKVGRPLSRKVTFHDPCYLGRHNGIVEQPRRVLRALGVELSEMAHHGADSLCCGGGGGRMWQQELEAEAKMSEIRIQEAAATGAQVVVTACPLCLIMLDDARKTAGLEDAIEVMDLNELVVQALGPADELAGQGGEAGDPA